MRTLAAAALLLLTASCVPYNNWSPLPLVVGPGHLLLTNFRFDQANVEAVVAGAPDCTPAPNAAPVDFTLPLKGTHMLEAPGGTDICWRRQTGSGQWTEWNHAFIAAGLSVEAQL